MGQQGNYSISTMTRSEMDFAIQLAAAEGWNPGLQDAECFYRTDPEGFLIGLLDGKPIGCISAVSYGRKFGFIGLYIILPEYRSRGYGTQLWQAAMKKLEGQLIGLDSVPGQTATYKRSGFRPAYRNIRYESRFNESPGAIQSGIIPLQDVPFNLIQQYDRPCFPAERTSFLQCWLKMPESSGIGYWESAQIKGYGVIRQCLKGYKIGPLLAEDGAIAERIFLNLVSKAKSREPIFLDVPEPNTSAMGLAQKYRMKPVFDTARMYSAEPPAIAIGHIFGVTSFELG